jgi:hypothetical protein
MKQDAGDESWCKNPRGNLMFIVCSSESTPPDPLEEIVSLELTPRQLVYYWLRHILRRYIQGALGLVKP